MGKDMAQHGRIYLMRLFLYSRKLRSPFLLELNIFKCNRTVHLDNNETTPVSKPAKKKMIRVLKKHYGNPSATYSCGREAANLIDDTRLQLAKSINANKDEVIVNNHHYRINCFVFSD